MVVYVLKLLFLTLPVINGGMNMISYRKYNNDVKSICDLWNEEAKNNSFYQTWEFNDMERDVFKNENFLDNLCYLAFDGEKVIGYILGFVRKKDLESETKTAYFHSVIVKREYRRCGIASKLYELLECNLKEYKINRVRCVYICPGGHGWIIPGTKNHLHPSVPAIPYNSLVYFFLTSVGFYVQGQIDAFHIDLTKFKFSEKIQMRIKELKEKNITFGYYNPKKHYGLKETCDSLGHRNAEEIVNKNIAAGDNRPYLVALEGNKVIGYTGYLYNEKDGRAHLDGVYLHADYRGGGIGKCMFNVLCEESRKNGSTYMSFFTGLENIARYIYISATGKIVQSFAIMAKDYK